ncbi:hypothetical protein [Mycobacterium sp. DL592]|uniref:hypothetical protein n=1 Tax=Mycobacterium sp. DL592 TaxID=2675524 RepID=UPI00141DD544|nr:hypothetical protein [Mycobacterium sp. DL592]
MSPKPVFPPNFRDSVKDTNTLVKSLLDRWVQVVGGAGQKWIDGFDKSEAQAVAVDIGEKFKDQVTEAWVIAEKDVKP